MVIFMKQDDSDRAPRYPVDARFFRCGQPLDGGKTGSFNESRADFSGEGVGKAVKNGEVDDKNIILDVVTRSDIEEMKNPFGSAFR